MAVNVHAHDRLLEGVIGQHPEADIDPERLDMKLLGEPGRLLGRKLLQTQKFPKTLERRHRRPLTLSGAPPLGQPYRSASNTVYCMPAHSATAPRAIKRPRQTPAMR
jgi:hypothetical protein